MRYSRLSRDKVKKIIGCFSEDITVTSASKILHINRNTVLLQGVLGEDIRAFIGGRKERVRRIR